ncbi:MAG: SufD family Fe-S cluster assembly protein [Candidatus Aenigmatarchaeota archaeon]
MKDVKNVNYYQVDHQVKQILSKEGVKILTTPEAWEKYNWVRKYFDSKPREGFFVWVKKQIDFPLSGCITISSPKISQDLKNVLVVEKNLKVSVSVMCNASRFDLCGTHAAQGKVILKKNSSLCYDHLQIWGEGDVVLPFYEFLLEKNSHLDYNFKNFFPPRKMKMKTSIRCLEKASVNLKILMKAKSCEVDLVDEVFLEEDDSSAVIRLRVVGEKEGDVVAHTKLTAKSRAKGHIDCQGLLLDKNSNIRLIPELVSKDKDATITHEASIGKISEEVLNYLMSRGLSEKEAVNLIVTGFLE